MTMQAIDEGDLQQCESCGKQGHISDYTIMEDCWFCSQCTADWQKHFDQCEHEWESEPHYSTMGDKGRICSKCHGFVDDETFKELFED